MEARTPWTTVDGGTETTAPTMLGLAVELLGRAVQAAEQRVGRVQVLGVGVAGLGESGVLLDDASQPCAPVIAWFDQRGARQVQQVGAQTAILADQFARRTGLPWDCQASMAKLLWLQSTGLALTPAHRWCSVPEWIVHRLGGCLIREPSLASRTGLVDQATGALWQEDVSAAGLPTTLLPPPVSAGVAAGSLQYAGLPLSLQGAALTVAGHDHPVAAIGAGAVGPDELFNSYRHRRRHRPLPARNLAESAFNSKPIGFGPMKFVEWVSGDHITWEANPDYFRGAPKIDRFILRFVPSTEAVLNAIRAGEVEIGWGLNEPSIPQLRQLESRGIRTIVDVIPNSPPV